jgi:D-xylose transport system permease protein
MSSIDQAVKPLSGVGSSTKPLQLSGRIVIPAICLIVSCVAFHYLSDGAFLTPRNLSNLSRQVCVNLTLAVGMTMVILTSGIDLSVGSVLALSGMTAAITQVHWGLSGWGATGAALSFIAALAVGGFTGAFTGLAISRLKITPFIVSLGMMVICRGLTLIVSSAQAVAPVGEQLGSLSSDYAPPSVSLAILSITGISFVAYYVYQYTKDGDWIRATIRSLAAVLFCGIAATIFCGYRGIPYMVFFAVACTVAGIFTLKFTRFGRFIYAIGGNSEAAHLSGVPVARTLWLVYFIMGLLAGLAGIMDTARVNGAVPSAGELAELDAIAAVVIGGTSLMGGMGSISGTLFGVLIMGVLNNGMSLMGISEHYQKVFKGVVIILAVYTDLRSKKNRAG